MYGSPHPRPEHLFSGLAKLVDRLSVPDEDAATYADNLNTFSTRISDPVTASHYRGHYLEELARKASFLDVSHLLIHGSLPNQEKLADFQSILSETSTLPQPVSDLIQQTPLHVGLPEFLRSVCGLLPLFDSQSASGSVEAIIWQSHRMLMQFPTIIVERHRLVQGWLDEKFDPELHWAVNLGQLLTNRTPTPLGERALEVLLMTRAEKGYDASTHAARLVASRGGSLYSAISTAMNSLPVDEHVREQQDALQALTNNNRYALEKWARSITPGQARLLGFGTETARESARLQLFNTFCHYLAEENELASINKSARRAEKIIIETTGLFPHSEWASVRMLHFLGIDAELNQPLQLLARISGWTAHVLEQLQQGPLVPSRLEYEGPLYADKKKATKTK